MALVVALAHQKGGVGKTTLTLNLYDYFSRQGTRCAIIEVDVQGSIRDLVETVGSQEEWGKLETLSRESFKNFADLSAVEDFDLLFIDTPPYLSNLLPEIFEASDLVLIPAKPSPLDALAIRNTVELVNEAKEQRASLKAAIVINMAINGTDFNKQAREALEAHGLPVFKTEIANRVAYSRSLFVSSSVSSERNPKAEAEIRGVANEMLALLNE